MLAKIIKTRREAMHLTQEELALAAKTTQATISRVETGGQLPNALTLFNIAQALGLEPGQLLEIAASSRASKDAPSNENYE